LNGEGTTDVSATTFAVVNLEHRLISRHWRAC